VHVLLLRAAVDFRLLRETRRNTVLVHTLPLLLLTRLTRH
jgi:hypothetical protein